MAAHQRAWYAEISQAMSFIIGPGKHRRSPHGAFRIAHRRAVWGDQGTGEPGNAQAQMNR